MISFQIWGKKSNKNSRVFKFVLHLKCHCVFPEMLMTRLAPCGVKKKHPKARTGRHHKRKSPQGVFQIGADTRRSGSKSKTQRIMTANGSVWETLSTTWSDGKARFEDVKVGVHSSALPH